MIKLTDLLNEDLLSDTYQLKGVLIVNTKFNSYTNIASDIRAIKGITILSEKYYPKSEKLSYPKYILSIKIDPSPFMGDGGFNKDSIDYIIKEIKKIKGVMNFITNRKVTKI